MTKPRHRSPDVAVDPPGDARTEESDYIVLRWPVGAENPGELLGAAELEVLLSILDGASDREIAAARGTSVRTVAAQTRAIYAKLGVSGRRAVHALFRGGADAVD